MNITPPARPILFCEGTPNSLDFALLDRICPSTIGKIVPIGGKTGWKRFIEGYSQAQAHPHYLVFRDRDFDLRPPPEIALLTLPESQEPIFLSYRTCIENYLLDGALLDGYYTHCQSPAWQFGPSPGIPILDQWIKDSAKAITAYQATRWALSDLKPKGGWIGFANTWSNRNDTLPDSVDEKDCLDGAAGLLDLYRQKITDITYNDFLNQYHKYTTSFEQPVFWNEKKYLLFFSGKDMASMMQRKQPDHLPPLGGFFKWAVKRLQWQDHPDLVSLAAKLNQPGTNL